MDLARLLSSINPVDKGLEPGARAHLDNLTKPRGSLGVLEDLAARYCFIMGALTPRLGKKRVVTFAGDHGVAAEGVSAYPKTVTRQMVRNMLAGGAAINVLGKHVGADVQVVDIGVEGPTDDLPASCLRRVKPGTDNIADGPAMSVDDALRSVEVGVELARDAHRDGVTLLGTGDMGIANTTPSSALFAALLPCQVEAITGRGTGIDDATLRRKVEVIKRALRVNKAHLGSPLEALAALGGFEIAGICGLILGAASCRIAVVVDGFISSAGALVACRLCPHVRDYLFFSHCSDEAGHKMFFRRFKAAPLLNLRMRLGEGTGAALAMFLIEAAVKVYNEMATFKSAGVSEKSS